MILLTGLVFLASCTKPNPNLSTVLDPEPVKKWCKVGQTPEALSDGLWTCTAVDENTAKAILLNKCLIYWARGVKASEVNCEY
jgi:hypothetical protein